jgi:trimeric autotransporter adhesin
MKKITIIIYVLCAFVSVLLSPAEVFAQAPQQFNYQAIARNSVGQGIANATIKAKISILDGSATAASVYSETRTVTTNQLGLFTIAIGSAGAASTTGVFATIDWSTGKKFIKVEVDPLGGNNLVALGSTELLSVPFALYAVNGKVGPAGPQGLQGNTGATGAQGIQGLAGATGAQGPIGLTGAIGATGLAGTNGTNGKNTLILTTAEAIGANCATGGVKQEYGIDANGNGTLEAGEINAALTKYVCNGAAGTAANAWGLTGNSATSPLVNFVGTTDNQALAIRTNNIDRVAIMGNNGFVGIGTTNPGSVLDVKAGSTPNQNLPVFAWSTSNAATFEKTANPATANSAVVGAISGVSPINIGVTALAKNATQNIAFYGETLNGPNDLAAKLIGKLELLDGTQGAGKILTSDATGRASWQTAAAATTNYWTATGNDISNNNSGNIGIGTTTPTTAKLVIAGTGGAEAIDLSSANQYANMRVIRNSLSSIDKDLYLGYQSGVNSSLHLYSNNSETVTLKNNAVGINKTNPNTLLHIGNSSIGALRIDGPAIPAQNSNNISVGGYGAIQVDAPGTAGGRFSLLENGNVGIGTGTPTSKLEIVGSQTITNGALSFNNTPNASNEITSSDGYLTLYGGSASGGNGVWINNTHSTIGGTKFQATGAIEFAGSEGTEGQVLTSNGAGIAASWSNNSNTNAYNSFIELEQTSNLNLNSGGGGTFLIVPGLQHNLVLTKPSLVTININIKIVNQGCFSCAGESGGLVLLIGSTAYLTYVDNIDNNSVKNFSVTRTFKLQPNTYNFTVRATKSGTNAANFLVDKGTNVSYPKENGFMTIQIQPQ